MRLHTLRVPGHDRIAVARAGARGATVAATLDAGAPFSMAGLVCDVPAAGAVTVALRASTDGASWTAWFEAPLEVVDEQGRAQAYIDPIYTGRARYVQVKARGTGTGPVALTGVRVVAIDPGPAASAASPARTLAASSASLDASTARGASSAPTIVTRAEWGADESLRSDSPVYSPVKMAFIHHTDGGNDYTQAQAPGIVRAIYAYHTQSLHWSDIGYNFLIDRFGTIYEGRYGGVSRGVVGAQAGGFNTGSTGISVMGDFIDAAPPAAAVSALERLLAWKLALSGVDPLGTARLTCGLTDKYKLGQVVTFGTISGHLDANYTDCPGKLYALLPAIRADVSQRMGSAAGVSLTADQTLISPNGDGVLDTVAFTAVVTPAADWRLVVRSAGGTTVASWSGTGGSGATTWDGTSGGATVPDGDYTAELTSSAASSASTATVTVDTTAPRLDEAEAAPVTFSPDGDGQTEATSVSYTPAEDCTVRVGIQDSQGNVVRWLRGWHAEDTTSHTASWDGRIKSGDSLVPAPDGQYRFDIERKDTAGNVARKGLKVLVDRTLGFPAVTPAAFSPNGDGKLDAATIAFRLTRKATVTVRFAVGGEVVRTVSAGALAAGARSVSWDGRDDAGANLASSKIDVTVVAASSLGASSVTARVAADLYKPRIYASGSKQATVGVATRLGYKVTDPFSAKADVSYVITDSKGRKVASGRPGKVATGGARTVRWKPSARGRFTVTWHAVDLAGNREAAAARTVVTVR